MDREYKGHGYGAHADDYCVVDLETTGIFVRSAKIIEISAIKVRGNQVTDEYSTLVNPECPIPPDATAVNHITDDMVKDSPTIDKIIDSFMSFVGEDIIVGYNNAGFDMNILYDTSLQLRGIPFSNNYIDMLHASRRCLSQLSNHRLETVSKHYSLDTEGEHRALKDCYLTKAVYDNIYKEYGDGAFKGKKHTAQGTVKHSAETLALQELQTLLETIIEDGEVTFAEFSSLRDWMENHRDLQGNYPFDRVFNALDKVLEDGKIEPDELEELQILFSDFVDPVQNLSFHDEIESFEGKHIVVTGDFVYGTRKEVFDLIESVGGINDKGVKKATDYVVVGAYGSENWKTGNYGGKIQKALELKDKGIAIEIVEEKDFIDAIQRILEDRESDNLDISSTTDDSSWKTVNEIDDNIENWQQDVRGMLDSLTKELELPEGSLFLSDNYGQSETTKGALISHSICIWEPDYPSTLNERPGPNKIVVTIVPSKVKSRPDNLDLKLRETQEGDLHYYLPEDAEILSQTKSEKAAGTIRIRIKKSSTMLTEYLYHNTIYCLQGYVSKASRFGACSRFIECSDAKRCVHENKLYSKACMYRDNLDQGRIFYGKNRNIN